MGIGIDPVEMSLCGGRRRNRASVAECLDCNDQNIARSRLAYTVDEGVSACFAQAYFVAGCALHHHAATKLEDIFAEDHNEQEYKNSTLKTAPLH
jgi:hypothetical protein